MQWADECTLASLRTLASPGMALELYAHLISTEQVWFARIQQLPPRHPVWPILDLEQCVALASENGRAYASFVATLGTEGLSAEVAYTNSAGASFRSRVGDILLHVCLHGSYHRGQVAALVRQAGGSPAPTDFIAFVRGAPAATRSSGR